MNASGLLARAEVCRLTTLSRTTIWRMVKAERFPKPRRISAGRVAWSRRAIEHWLAEHGGADNATS
jgi:prophage regulatory protein